MMTDRDRNQLLDVLTLAAWVAFVVWVRRSERAELERALARVEEWDTDRRLLEEERRRLHE
jgi:hypothetical protein